MFQICDCSTYSLLASVIDFINKYKGLAKEATMEKAMQLSKQLPRESRAPQDLGEQNTRYSTGE